MLKDLFDRSSSNPSAVELANFRPPQIFYDIITELKGHGFSNPIIHGGALRDAYIGKRPRDIDLTLSWADFGLAETQFKATRKFDRTLRKAMTIKGEFIIFQDGKLEGIEYPLDCKTIDRSISAKDITLWSDATINAIAMGGDCKVFAHPKFEHDANELIYRPTYTLPINFIRIPLRYNYFKKKFPGLSLELF